MNDKTLCRILLVEDDPDIREVAQMALEAVGGYTVGLCTDGEDALEKAAEFAPDLILLDVMMPRLDGPRTLAALREIPAVSAVPVAFMTAKAQLSEVAQYREQGAVDVISKPFDPMTLADTVRSIWEGVGSEEQ